ncbi:bifunctional diguanylate cyclase/phosphodiesterase [Rhodocyclus tenuis]|uniref:Diguanylate cyclase (GGDEF)-like protein/PAS domain S-box-containing protein n=1 Tax=Rhodocyclus tenuis TaxID=1066 RepID=A0A840GAG3_RHOTE|nr:EAL domain-containing protein [Rhodocyclus tenuis]MBB4248471.1 diguanylate cyclase (GGDEF)-like protein/PAS domain S-box-containing protein [Rhodocyclus tenuis]
MPPEAPAPVVSAGGKGWRAASRNGLFFWPALSLVLSLSVTGLLWQDARESADKDLQLDFDAQATAMVARLHAELATRELLLRGFAGLFKASDHVSREDFRHYYEILPADLREGSATSVAFHQQVAAADLPAHEESMRRAGFPDYRVFPPGARATYAPLVYIEPLHETNRRVIGFDPLTVEVERLAIARARASGDLALSARLVLAQDNGTRSPGFVMYVPIYKSVSAPRNEAEREAAFVGWLDAPFRMSTFMAVLPHDALRNIDLQIFDGRSTRPEALLYDANTGVHQDAELPGLRVERELGFGGHSWTLVFRSQPGFGGAAPYQKAQFVAAVGVLLSVLVCLLSASLINGYNRRMRAEYRRHKAAEQAVQDAERQRAEAALRESEARYQFLFRHNPMPMWVFDRETLAFLEVNDRAVEHYGYSREEFARMHIADIRPAEEVPALLELVGSASVREIRREWRHRRRDGSLITVLTNVEPMVYAGRPAMIVLIQDITARKAAEAEVNTLAFFDPLTGLPNRRLLIDRLQHALATVARVGGEGALLLIDLDNFKTLNDTLGHDIGDLLLQQVARRLQHCVVDGGTVARLGGDEFVVVLESLGRDGLSAAAEARKAGEAVLAALIQPYQLGAYSHLSTPSIGIALFDRQQETDSLLRQADLAMYQAKAAGRNSIRFFDPAMQAAVTTRAQLEADLRDALAKDEFRIFLQAQVAADGRIIGAEALLRWFHPLRGCVSPAEFIAVAEDTGMILAIGDWVLEAACACLAAWAKQPATAELTLSVNVSARQFRQTDFVPSVLAVLARFAVAPTRLKLELTENMLVDDVEDVIGKMSALKAEGVAFALDDFGTGYSSLSLLKRLPLYQLKIDQGFVRDILCDANDAAIAKMVIALARTMGLSVLAEGVELDAQRDFLAHHGCDAYQGYLFGCPQPVEDFTARFAAG